jgi:hypothetical protein
MFENVLVIVVNAFVVADKSQWPVVAPGTQLPGSTY